MQMMQSDGNLKYKHSILLTKDENDKIFNLLGPKCQALSTTVVQFLCTESLDCKIHFEKKDIGVLCFVRDVNRRSHLFRLYCTLRNRMIWEHEIHNGMQYSTPTPLLLTFEGKEQIVAFEFLNEEEAAHMREILQKKLDKKRKKKIITKAAIGKPQNFRHVSHVGWDSNNGIDLKNIDESMKKFFEKARISENDLKDEETREFIFNFIEKHGGLDAVKQDIQRVSMLSPPPVPSRNEPLYVNFCPPRPPLPSRNSSTSNLAFWPSPPPVPPHYPLFNVTMHKSHNSMTQSGAKKKKSPTKTSIGNPQNFRHVSHVGKNSTNGFDFKNIDDCMRKFFEKARISESDLKNEKTREFIYDFIEKHGGLEAVKQDINRQ